MKTALVIRHVAFEDLGTLGPALLARGYTIRYLEMGQEDIAGTDPAEAALAVILGGPIGVYEQEEYPFLQQEVAWIAARLAAGKPTIGLCLGAQLMAAALGARVYGGGNGKEIGWSALTPTPAAKKHAFMTMLNVPVLHWHGDTFDLPEGATLLAGTAQYAHQVYSVGSHAIAFQCHPEVTERGLERWYIGHACEISQTPGVSVPDLRNQTARHGRVLEETAGRVWPLLLDGIGA
jgi:GMP synthase (glutamine-hydrolysing)